MHMLVDSRVSLSLSLSLLHTPTLTTQSWHYSYCNSLLSLPASSQSSGREERVFRWVGRATARATSDEVISGSSTMRETGTVVLVVRKHGHHSVKEGPTH